MAKLSVIIPVYNVAKYLRQCLDSVVYQTFTDFEVICVNDGSTDNSLEILKEYEAKDKRFKIIDKQNGGLSSARNAALEFINGEYTYFLDSDDYISLNLFEYAMTIFKNFDIDLFCFSAKSFVDDVNIMQSQVLMDNYLSVKRDGYYALSFDICYNTNIQVFNKIFKTKKIIENNLKFIEGLLFEDIYFTWAYLLNSNKAYFEGEIFYHYRLRSNSIMENAIRNRTEKAMDHLYNWKELMLKIYSDKDLFLEKYDTLLTLLDEYCFLTKRMISVDKKYKAEKLKLEYLEDIKDRYNKLQN